MDLLTKCFSSLPTTQNALQHLLQSPSHSHIHTMMAYAAMQGADLLICVTVLPKQSTPQYFYAQPFKHGHIPME